MFLKHNFIFYLGGVKVLRPKYFDLMKEHYKRVFYYPDTEYRLYNPFIVKRYAKFDSEEDFRRELFRVKPVFVMNSIGDLLFFDFDFKMKIFSREKLQKALSIVYNTLSKLEKMIEINDSVVVFSGRGFHLYVYTPHIKRIYEKYEEVGFSLTSDFVATLNRTLTYALVNASLGKGEKKIKNLEKYLDVSSGSVGKMVRTPLSINNKSFLPVVPVTNPEEFDLDYILNIVREPRSFKVSLRRKMPVRVGERYEFTDNVVIDEYELMRLLINYNLLVKNVVEKC